MSELDLLLNSSPDVPDAPPNPHPDPDVDVDGVPDQIPESVTQDLGDLDSLLTDLPRVPDAAPGAALTPDQQLASLPDLPDTPLGPPRTPEELRLLADLPDVPEGSPWQTSGDGSGGSPSGRAGDSEQGDRSSNDLDRLLRERLDRLKNQQDPDGLDADLAARLAKLREGGPDGLGRPARVDELREQYLAALEEEGTGGPDRDGTAVGSEDDASALPYTATGGSGTPNATGGTAAPQRPTPTVSTTTGPNSGNTLGGSRPQSPAGTNPDGLDASLPDVPQEPRAPGRPPRTRRTSCSPTCLSRHLPRGPRRGGPRATGPMRPRTTRRALPVRSRRTSCPSPTVSTTAAISTRCWHCSTAPSSSRTTR